MEIDSAIWGLVGTAVGAVVGAGSSIATTWLSNRHAAKLDRAKGDEERAERFRDFQRKTLLEIQEAAQESLRFAAREHIEDIDATRSSGRWGGNITSDDVREGQRTALHRLVILRQRVADDDLRSQIVQVTQAVANVSVASSQQDSVAKLEIAYAIADRTHESLGKLLRSMY